MNVGLCAKRRRCARPRNECGGRVCNGPPCLGYKHVFGLLDSNNLRSKEIQKSERPTERGSKEQMAPDSNTQRKTTTARATAATNSQNSTGASRSDSAQIREGLTKARNGGAAYARQAAERSVDLPFGAALTVADRVTGIVEPFTARASANRELKSIRTRVERELNRFERRGASARRKTRTRVRRTRNRVERELKQRRRRVGTTVKQNRVKAEDGLKRAQTVVQERVSTLV